MSAARTTPEVIRASTPLVSAGCAVGTRKTSQRRTAPAVMHFLRSEPYRPSDGTLKPPNLVR